jgi:hypothetical protein
MVEHASPLAGSGEQAARLLLERASRHPLHPEYFSSNSLFGQPGIYPGGPAMAPASGAPLDEHGARAVLCDLVGDPLVPGRSGGDRAGDALAWFDDPTLRERVPDALVRAALLLLSGGPAEPVLHAFLREETPVRTLGIGVPVGQGRIIGLAAEEGAAEEGAADGGATGDGAPPPDHRVLNERYASEHPAVVAPSLAHALCHHGERASDAEEATLHGLLASVHAWLLSLHPELARLGTELSRRQASLTITLLNARAPGSWRASIRCPDGPGTIPGGNAALQCPDLWSIPFTALPTAKADLTLPEPVRASLSRLAAEDAPPPPLTYDDALGAWLTAELGEGPWFGAGPRARAGRALGLL